MTLQRTYTTMPALLALAVSAWAAPAIAQDVEKRCAGEWRGAWKAGNTVGDVGLTITTTIPGEFNLIRAKLVLSNAPAFPRPIVGAVEANGLGVSIEAVGENGWNLGGTLYFNEDDQVLEGDVRVVQGNDPNTASIVSMRLRRL